MDDKRLTRIEDKLDNVAEHISDINVTLGQQHVSLVEHIRRTAALEDKVIPLEKHVAFVHAALKIIGFIAVLATIGEGAVEILKYLGK